jgi:hypothetical protein
MSASFNTQDIWPSADWRSFPAPKNTSALKTRLSAGIDVAKLADAPDLGSRNHRFQSVSLHCNSYPFYEGKTYISGGIMDIENDE